MILTGLSFAVSRTGLVKSGHKFMRGNVLFGETVIGNILSTQLTLPFVVVVIWSFHLSLQAGGFIYSSVSCWYF